MLTGQCLSFIVSYFFKFKVCYPICVQRHNHKRVVTCLSIAERKLTFCDNAEEQSGVTVDV
jgi:hypothetical protein